MRFSAKTYLLSCENEFYLQENKSHFHINSFAVNFALNGGFVQLGNGLFDKKKYARRGPREEGKDPSSPVLFSSLASLLLVAQRDF